MSETSVVEVPVLECRGLAKTYVSGPLAVPVLLGIGTRTSSHNMTVVLTPTIGGASRRSSATRSWAGC